MSDPDDLEARAAAMKAEIAARVEAQREALYGGRRTRRAPGPAARMRLVLLSAFIVFLLAWVGRNSAGPLGVQAAFTPAEDGDSFAGHRTFDGGGDPVTVGPGDVVGAHSGDGATLRLADGSLVLDAGARAVIASLMPPRARLIGGAARADGRLRVVTANGIVDVDGTVGLVLDAQGLAVSVESGEATVTSLEGERTLEAGARATFR